MKSLTWCPIARTFQTEFSQALLNIYANLLHCNENEKQYVITTIFCSHCKARIHIVIDRFYRFP